MEYAAFTVFVEGSDDMRFVEAVIQPELEKRYGEDIDIIDYPHKQGGFIDSLITAITEDENADYLFLADFDSAPCITEKKREWRVRYPHLAAERTVIVAREIESWYLAGLDDASCRRFKIPLFARTDRLTKEAFNAIIPKRAKTRTDFLFDVLNYFDLATAKRKNASFRYFIEKHFPA